MRIALSIVACIALLLVVVSCGCTVISRNRAFPTVTPFWTSAAKQERADRKADKIRDAEYRARQPAPPAAK